jgi:hypothetical protein
LRVSKNVTSMLGESGLTLSITSWIAAYRSTGMERLREAPPHQWNTAR